MTENKDKTSVESRDVIQEAICYLLDMKYAYRDKGLELSEHRVCDLIDGLQEMQPHQKAINALVSGEGYVSTEDTIRLEWRKGEPPVIYRGDWFIAKLNDNSRVVLRALYDEHSYDYETRDGTYLMAYKIKQWMQFPDDEFCEPEYESRYLKAEIIKFKAMTQAGKIEG